MLPDDRRSAWLLTLVVTAFAGFLRFWHLDYPRKFLFDETYYAKDGWSLVHHGYVTGYVENANNMILAGNLRGLWNDQPSMVVHPEVGKWLIGSAEWLFGMTPYGWRFAPAVIGTLMVLVMIRLVRRMTHSTAIGLVAGLLMCFDGLHFVLSRLALLDIFQAFFVLCAVSAMVADRDWFRERLDADRVLLWRPWLLLAGLWWGLAIGTKWGSLYLLAAFGLLFWGWSAVARWQAGFRLPWLRSALVDALPAVGYIVVLPVLVYLATWTGWLLHAHEYELAFSNTQYGPYWGTYLEKDATGFLGELGESLRSLWHYHHDVYSFHTKHLDDATHVYASNPIGWPILNRPVGVDAVLDIKAGEQGCDATGKETCLRQIILLGTPALWWLGCVALLWGIWRWLNRDWRYGVALVGFTAAWLPWLTNADRPIFSYYAIVMEPFLVLAIALVLCDICARVPYRWGVAACSVVVLLVAANFAWFWPVYTDGMLSRSDWLQRIWFDRWI